MTIKSNILGRLIGKDNSGRILVRVDHRVMPEFGELWIVDDDAQEACYFARVIDTMYAADPKEASDYAKTMLDNPEMSLDETDREFLGYNLALVDLLGIVRGEQIDDYYRIPSILSIIRTPTNEEFEAVVKY